MNPALTRTSTMKSWAALLTRAGMAKMAWWTQRYTSSFWHTHLSLHCQLSKCHNSGIFLMLLESSDSWISHLSFISEKTIKQILSGSEARNQILFKSVTLKTISVSWDPGTQFFNSKRQCWEEDTAKRAPNSDTQNTCSANHDWS